MDQTIVLVDAFHVDNDDEMQGKYIAWHTRMRFVFCTIYKQKTTKQFIPLLGDASVSTLLENAKRSQQATQVCCLSCRPRVINGSCLCNLCVNGCGNWDGAHIIDNLWYLLSSWNSCMQTSIDFYGVKRMQNISMFAARNTANIRPLIVHKAHRYLWGLHYNVWALAYLHSINFNRN